MRELQGDSPSPRFDDRRHDRDIAAALSLLIDTARPQFVPGRGPAGLNSLDLPAGRAPPSKTGNQFTGRARLCCSRPRESSLLAAWNFLRNRTMP